VWTAKRIVILVAGLFLFLTGFFVYDFFLGQFDNLPQLDAKYYPNAVGEGAVRRDGAGEMTADKMLEKAFGPNSPELSWPIRLVMRDKGIALAAGQFEIMPDGRVKLAPFSVAMYSKKTDDGFPEINTIRTRETLLKFDRPVANLAELNSRKIMEAELLPLPSDGVLITNNRRTAAKGDDLEIKCNGALYYSDPKNLIWTDDYVVLVDMQSQPEPTRVQGLGMDMKLSKDASPNRPKPAPGAPVAKAKSDASSVEQLTLRSSVRMYLFIDAKSGFLASSDDFNAGGKTGMPQPMPSATAKTAPPERSKVSIQSNSFTYDLLTDKAWFESLISKDDVKLTAPNHVEVTREHLIGKEKKLDHLTCAKLALQLRRKLNPAVRDPRTGDKEIETALATAGPNIEVVLAMNSENLEAYGTELFYRCPDVGSGPQTILRGNANRPVQAVKDGHKIDAAELHLIGADKTGEGQRVTAKGPGEIKLLDSKAKGKDPHYPARILWRDTLVSVKEREGLNVYDLITLHGDAWFIDDDQKQNMHGDKIHVWLQNSRDALGNEIQATGANRQKLHKVLAIDNVSVRTPEVVVRRTNRMTITFVPEVGSGQTLPMLDDPNVAKEGGPKIDPNVDPKPPEGRKPGPVEEKKQGPPQKPIELQADSVVVAVSTNGTKKQMQQLVAEGKVYVVQDGDKAGEKKLEIQGHLLKVDHDPLGDKLTVHGETKKPNQMKLEDLARLAMGDMKLWGPVVTINQKDNRADVVGFGVLQMPSNSGFDGKRPESGNANMTITWVDKMVFDGKMAEFFGNVQGQQEAARLRCDSMLAIMDRVISFKEGQKENKGAKVDYVQCNHRVYIVDEKRDNRGKILQASIFEGKQMEVDNGQNSSLLIGGGAGRVRHLAPGSSDLGAPGQPVDPKKAGEQEMKLTRIEFKGNMFSKMVTKTSKQAKFYDQVEVYHFAAERIDAEMDANRPPKNGFYLRCETLNVSTQEVEGKTSQRMHAERNVEIRTENITAFCDTLKYDEAQDQIILEGKDGNPVQLFEKKIDQAQPKKVSAGRILYNRKAGTWQIDKGSVIQSRLAPRETPPAVMTDSPQLAGDDAPRLPVQRILIVRHTPPPASRGLSGNAVSLQQPATTRYVQRAATPFLGTSTPARVV
jgi:hypothetical protein